MNAETVTFRPAVAAVADPRRELENAVVRLLKSRPFYGHLLLGFRRRVESGDHPLGVTVVNGTPSLIVDSAKFSAFTPVEQQALLEHGLKHILHLHPVRGRGWHRLTWNLACDLAINPFIPGLPLAAPRPEQFRFDDGLAAEEYARLLKPRLELGSMDGEGVGDAGCEAGGQAREDQAGRTPLDDHALWSEAESTPERLVEQVVRDLVREAYRKACGEVPDDLRPLVEGWLVPPAIPWREVLRQFVGTAGRVGRQSTWQREHRRFEHNTPGNRKRRLLNLLVAVDVSESTDRQPLREAFARELLQIARSRDSRITVLYAHSRIRRIEQFRSSQAVAEVVHGGGFTDLRPVFAYAGTMHPRPAAVIYLTDGEGPAPEAMEFPTLWVLTPDGRKPTEWGVELRLQDG